MKPRDRNTTETTGFYACWFCLWVAPLVGFAQPEVTARKWQVHELILEAEQSYQWLRSGRLWHDSARRALPALLNFSLYQDVKHLVDFFTNPGIAYWKMHRANHLIKGGERVYALAEPGKQYIFYAAIGGQFVAELPKGKY